MNLWNLINESLSKKNLSKTNLYEEMNDIFENTDYEVPKYKAFLKRFDTSKMTVEELLQMSYILDINIGELQDVFNSRINSLLNTRNILDYIQLDSIKKYSKFYELGDYYEIVDIKDLSSQRTKGTHYLININHNTNTISLELVDINKSLIITIGYIKDASNFIIKKSDNFDKFKLLSKPDKVKLILERIELENQIYGSKPFKHRPIIQNILEILSNIEYLDLKIDNNKTSWSYNDKKVLFAKDSNLSQFEFEGYLEYTKLANEFKEKEDELTNKLPFDSYQCLTIGEMCGKNVALYFDADSRNLEVEIVDNITELGKDIYPKFKFTIYPEVESDSILTEDRMEFLKGEMFKHFKNYLLKNGDYIDLPNDRKKAMEEGIYKEKELYKISDIFKNLNLRTELKNEISRLREELFIKKLYLGGNKHPRIDELPENYDELFVVRSLPLSVKVSYIKIGNSPYEYKLIAETLLNTIESDIISNQYYEIIDSKCLYDSTEPELYSDFDYNNLPKISFDLMNNYLNSVKI